MRGAFRTKAFVGWQGIPPPLMARDVGKAFIKALDKRRTVLQAVKIARGIDTYREDRETKLMCVEGEDVVVDLTP